MSDLSMYELEDIIWDDFDRSDDHIVPHPTNARTSRNSFEGDSCKKPRREATPVLSNLDASNSICQEKADRESKPLDKKTIMMEKESPAHTPLGVFNASCDGEIVKNMPNLASDDTKLPNNCFKNSYDRVLSGTSAAGDNNSYGDLSFVGNNCEDKESSHLLYYGWSDIGNFEDVDKMLRSCDSSFGLGVTNNDDELGWFTSDQIGNTEEALKMDFNFPCPEPSDLKNILADNNSPESNNHGSSCISENKKELNFKDQKKRPRHQNQTEGSFVQISENQLPSNNTSDHVFTSIGNRKHYRNLEFDNFGQMHSNTSYLPPDYHHPYRTTSGIKSEHKGFKSPSPKGSSSYASTNHGPSIESSGEPSFEQKQARNSQDFQPLFIPSPQMDMKFQSPSGVAKKQAHVKEMELESQIQCQSQSQDMEEVQKGVEMGSLNVPETSCVSSELDEISLEATSFRQLRQVMQQLDMRTKLCIRDSLYRLARSAEQRHNNPTLSNDINDLGVPLMAERTNKCSGFMDIETDTNPIDRSVAHLLFHRPTESPNFPLKQNLNHGPIAGPSMMVEKQEEAEAESNDKICGDRN